MRLLLCLWIISIAASDEQTMRTTSTTDVQVCVDGVLSDERDAVQTAVLGTLTVGLSSSAVYPVRRYTTASGAVCFLYVYQATSPDAARLAVVQLGQLGSALPIIYKNTQIQGRFEAVPWRSEDPPLGAWAPSTGDVILWGSVGGGVLLACILSMCCFAVLQSANERRRAERLLASDRRLRRSEEDV